MARPIRIEYEGASYHMMARGNERRAIFRWSARHGARAVHHRVRELAAKERDDRLKIWVRVRLGAERLVDIAKEVGYRDGSSVLHAVKRLERRAMNDSALAQTLVSLRQSVKNQELAP